MKRHLTKRDGLWHYARRVPASVMALDGRGVVRATTKIRVADDPRGIKAARVAERINAETEAFWTGLVQGRAVEAQARYDAARARAKAWGFDYLTAEQVAAAPLADVLKRVDAFARRGDDLAASAVLGGEQPPKIALSRLFEEYEIIARTENRGLSPDQLRRWQAPRLKAIRNLQALIGDKPLGEISRGDALDFQGWWRDRILSEDLDIGTGNRDIGHLAHMLKEVDRRHRLGLDLVFNDLRISGEREKSRSAYPAAFVQGIVLAEGALDSMNAEQRRIIYLVAETGLRLSEACNLTRDTIVLDAAVPHVQVRADGRRTKTEQSVRDIPLVGVALAAMRAQPDGFPRYRDKAAGLSASANKTLGSLKMRPTPDHSIYSLRHTFEDRLTAVEAPEKLIAALMGHKHSRPKYGSGPSLEQKREWLQRIAFTPPSNV